MRYSPTSRKMQNKRQNREEENGDGVQQLMSPKPGGRGLKNKDMPYDKVVRITSDIYNEILNSELGKKIRLASLNADFHDVLSEVLEFYKEKHRKGA